MTDNFGRTIDYLRVSVTDRCNLRCVYCMPEDGVDFIHHGEILRFEEILRLCRILAGQGIGKVKVTGGEPLVRRGVTKFIGELKQIPGIEQVTLTCNGTLLPEHLDDLISAGLDGVNVSLDAVNPAVFSRITRGGEPHGALLAVGRAAKLGLPVKVNCVPVREFNGGEILSVAALARDKDIAVRFIELMPLGDAGMYHVIPADEIKRMLMREYGELIPFSGRLGNGPAVYYKLSGFRGKIGFISAVSCDFCKSCNRLRLTSHGLLKPCLAHEGGLQVKTMLRGGESDEEIAKKIVGFVTGKPRGHEFSSDKEDNRHEGMFRTGG
ncbi:MAG: GTP 3',8-cyclase MoaA [Oscillospiraceae bacterium]|nr:GTP 3',8-cyclase MoaA [Oscillospiraceae bacterium]